MRRRPVRRPPKKAPPKRPPVDYAGIYADLSDGFGTAGDQVAFDYWLGQGHDELPARLGRLEARCTALERGGGTVEAYEQAVGRLVTFVRRVREEYEKRRAAENPG